MSKFQHQIVACLIFCYVIRLTTGNKRNPFSACASKESNIIQWRARIAECLTNLNECLLEEGLKQDVDICQEMSQPCHRNAQCINIYGSLMCQCKPGYTGDGRTCRDIDECSRLSPCSKQATCQNTNGSYSCSCNNGYSGNGYVCRLTDDNSCKKIAPSCHGNVQCVNSMVHGSVMCQCNSGKSSHEQTCFDIKKCEIVKNCHIDSNGDSFSLNLEGSYMCDAGDNGDGNTCVGVFRPTTCWATAAYFIEGYHLVSCPSGCQSYWYFIYPSIFHTNKYTRSSSICAAAIHEKIIGDKGGNVILYKKSYWSFYVYKPDFS